MSLKSRIIDRIREEGPLSIAEYMAAALFDRREGFYPTRDPLGVDGDFITAPEISQVFGELIGLWCLQSWRDLGCPHPVHLIELGPGRGTMMSDILRGARIDPAFLAAVEVTLIEASAALEAKQAQTLGGFDVPVNWVDSLENAPTGNAIIIGNEFLDCLPIRQFVRQNGAWHERVVAIDPDNEDSLIFALGPAPISAVDAAHFPAHPTPKDGDLFELCPGALQLTQTLSQRFEINLGRALFIDYGPAQTEFGDTLQAIAKHVKTDPLAAPGNADLTARVDFQAFGTAAAVRGLTSFLPVTQAALMQALGADLRFDALKAAHPHSKDVLERQRHRLMDASEMGELFKAVSLQSAGLPYPPGFEKVHAA